MIIVHIVDVVLSSYLSCINSSIRSVRSQMTEYAHIGFLSGSIAGDLLGLLSVGLCHTLSKVHCSVRIGTMYYAIL